MMFEARIRFADNQGKPKTKRFLIEYAICYSDAESQIVSEFGELDEFSVVSLRKSSVKEIVRLRKTDYDKVFVARLSDKFVNKSRRKSFKVALYAKTMEDAQQYVRHYASGMAVCDISCGRYDDILSKIDLP